MILYMYFIHIYNTDFLGGSDGKESSCNAGDPGLIPGLDLERFPGEGNAYPLHNSMDGGAWRAAVHVVTKSFTRLKQLSMCVCVCVCIYIYIFSLS